MSKVTVNNIGKGVYDGLKERGGRRGRTPRRTGAPNSVGDTVSNPSGTSLGFAEGRPRPMAVEVSATRSGRSISSFGSRAFPASSSVQDDLPTQAFSLSP